MRILSLKGYKWDKKYLIATLVTILCAFICGIVLCIVANVNIYLKNYATDYIFYVYNFNIGGLFGTHFLAELLYIYIFFLLGLFCRTKYVTLIFVFIRSLFFSAYTTILISVGSFGGGLVVFFVFLPCAFLSLIICFFTVEWCKCLKRPLKIYVFLIPAFIALLNCLVLTFLIGVVFRVVIIIV